MIGRQIIIGPLLGTDAAALMQDGQLQDLAFSTDIAFAPGAILRARVQRLIKGQGGVFLRLPDGSTGYLRDRNGLRQGQPLIVQVSGTAEEGKAVPLSSRVLFKGRNIIVTPGAPGVNISRRIRDTDRREDLSQIGAAALAAIDSPPGLIFRSIAAEAKDDDIRAELEQLLALSTAIMSDESQENELLLDAPSPEETAWCDWHDPEPDSVVEGETAMADCGVIEAVQTLLKSRVALGATAWASIDSLPALTAIDVNTGGDHSPAAGLKTNILLARDLPRQLRLRGIGGQIVIDFAPMPKRDRGTLEQTLKAAFKTEGAEVVLMGWTNMGLFEISRKRDRTPLRCLTRGLT